jgi:hypothetical protein
VPGMAGDSSCCPEKPGDGFSGVGCAQVCFPNAGVVEAPRSAATAGPGSSIEFTGMARAIPAYSCDGGLLVPEVTKKIK